MKIPFLGGCLSEKLTGKIKAWRHIQYRDGARSSIDQLISLNGEFPNKYRLIVSSEQNPAPGGL